MLQKFLLPDVGEGLTEAEIVQWLVAVGDEVQINQVIVEIETAKSIVELPCPFAGRVVSLLVAEGAEVEVGTAILEVEDGVDGSADEQPPTLVGYGAADRAPRRRRRRAGTGGREPGEGEGQVRAKPPVRKYARDLGIDLGDVTGTGPDGAITRRDVEAAHKAQHEHVTDTVMDENPGLPAGEFDPIAGSAQRRVPIKGVRKATAENLVRSVEKHVHVMEWVTIDVTATMDFVDHLKGRHEFAGLKISPLLIYAKAICLALGRNPDLNVSVDEQRQEIIYHHDVHLGIAAATPRGLMVPNIKSANRMSLLELCRAINQLVQVAKDGKLQPTDYQGGTFTLTNVGVFGIDAGTPVINGDESAILCMGAITRRPWVVGAEERIEPRWVTTLALAFDHRIIDGEGGSKFLADVAEILSDPAKALLY